MSSFISIETYQKKDGLNCTISLNCLVRSNLTKQGILLENSSENISPGMILLYDGHVTD